MQTIEEKTRLTFFNKKFKLCLQLILLGVVFFFVFDQGVLNEVRYVFDALNLKNADKIVLQIIMPFKAFFDLSQLISLTFFIFKIVLAVVAVPLIIYFFVETFRRLFIERKLKGAISQSISTANYQAVYIVQSKFLC